MFRWALKSPPFLHEKRLMAHNAPTLKDPDGRFAALVEPVVNDHGCRLVRVSLGGGDKGQGRSLQVLMEPVDGTRLQLDTCSKVSRALGAVLDVEDPIKSAYTLEVSSPGLDRFLTAMEDFKRFEGFEIKLETKMPSDSGQKRYRGVLKDVTQKTFGLLDDQNAEFTFELGDVASARLVATDQLVKMAEKGEFPKPVSFEEQ